VIITMVAVVVGIVLVALAMMRLPTVIKEIPNDPRTSARIILMALIPSMIAASILKALTIVLKETTAMVVVAVEVAAVEIITPAVVDMEAAEEVAAAVIITTITTAGIKITMELTIQIVSSKINAMVIIIITKEIMVTPTTKEIMVTTPTTKEIMVIIITKETTETTTTMSPTTIGWITCNGDPKKWSSLLSRKTVLRLPMSLRTKLSIK
jgi:hypothetical protein